MSLRMLLRNLLPRAVQATCPHQVVLDLQPLHRAAGAHHPRAGWLAHLPSVDLSATQSAGRSIATSAAASNSLSTVLKAEAAYEDDSYSKPEVSLIGAAMA